MVIRPAEIRLVLRVLRRIKTRIGPAWLRGRALAWLVRVNPVNEAWA